MKRRSELFIGILFFAALILLGITSYSVTVQTIEGPYETTPVAADSLDVTWAASVVAGTTFTHTGKEIVLLHNTAGVTGYATFHSVADNLNRKGDIENYAIGADEYVAWAATAIPGWRDATGEFTITTNATTVNIMVLRIPN